MGNRVIKVLQNGEWVVKPFGELQVGDKFQIFDDGILFMDSYGRDEWTVSKVPVVPKGEIAFVEVEVEIS